MDEITFLTATVNRLDCEIQSLNDYRASLLRRLNQIKPSTRILPPETLALIFHHASQHIPLTADFFPNKKPSRTSPLLIGSVCSHWRQIAWSTPMLWTYIDPVPIRRNAQHTDAALLRLYFKNARALPVSLQIKLDRLSSSPSAASEEILRAVFLENSRNIGVLMCTSKSSLRQRWAMLAPKLAHSQFPNLERLEINLRGAPLSRYDTPMFTHAPKLTRALFSGYQLPHETFWEQITVLELSALPVSQCLETLVRCPNLIDFRCTSPRPSHKSVDSAMHGRNTPVTFSHLEKFEWIGALAEWDIFLYTYVRLPNLRHLILGNSHPLSRPLGPPIPPSSNDAHTTDPELWKSFLRYIKDLTILECTVFHSAQEWLDIFDIFSPSVHTLRFTAFRDAEETVRLLRALQLTYEGDGDTVEAETRNYLPNLRVLNATLDLHPDRSKHVLDILCSRRLRPMVPVPPSSNLPLNIANSPTESTSTISTLHSLSDSTPSIVILDTDADTEPETPSIPIPPTPTTPSTSSTTLQVTTIPMIPRHRTANDYLLNRSIDYTYWSNHTRLEEVIIKCWPFGFDFGEREREIARMLKEGGLKLDVFGQASRVDWL